RIHRVGHFRALGAQTNQAFAVGRERNDGWGGVGTFSVFEHLGLGALHDRDAGIGGAEVYAALFGQVVFVPLFCGAPSGPKNLAPGAHGPLWSLENGPLELRLLVWRYIVGPIWGC